MKTLATLTLTAALALGFTAATAQAQQPGAHFLENFDGNGDGQVTLAEVREKRGEIFYMLDQDENGALDSAEYDLFDATRAADRENQAAGCGKGGQGGKGDQGSGMTREVTDLNGDGMVTEAEFLQAADAWFAQKDRNGDNLITAADFGPRGN